MDKELKDIASLTKNERLDMLGQKIAENEELIKENEKLNERCYVIAEKINYQSERNKNFQHEVEYKQNLCKQIERTYKSIISNNPDTIKNVEEMKNDFIKNKIEELLHQNIPEINHIKSIYDEEIEVKQNEFHDLIFDNVTIIHTEYEKINESWKKREEKRGFRISKRTDFKTLKMLACNYFDIENMEDHVLTDDAEALISNDKCLLDDFFRNYSIFNNTFRLISISYLKSRSQLIDLQEYRMKVTNKLNLKDLKKDDNVRYKTNFDYSGPKIKEFFSEYSALKPFILQADEKLIKANEKRQNSSTKYEASFFMILALILFFIFNLISIYSPRDISANNLKIKYISDIFSNVGVNDYKSLYSYLITKIGFNFFNVTVDDINNHTGGNSPNNTYIENSLNVFGFNTSWFLVQNQTDPLGNIYNVLDMNHLKDHLDNYKQGYVNFVLASSIHFIVDRVNTANCSNGQVASGLINTNQICYDILYDSSTAERKLSSTYSLLYLNLFEYKTAEQAEIHLDISSRSGQLDGSGYHFDIKGNTTFISYMQFMSQVIPINPQFNQATNSTTVLPSNDINNYPFVNSKVRAIIIQFSLYFPSDKTWMNCLVSFDFLPTGVLLPGLKEFRTFKASVYTNKGLLFIDILRLCIVFIFMISMVKEIYEKHRENRIFIYEVILPKNILNVAIFILYFYTFVIKISACNRSDEDFFSINGQVYTDTYLISENYNIAFIIESLLFVLISIKLFNLLKINSKFGIFYSIDDFAIRIFTKYLFFVISVLIGFASVAHILWGPFLSQFKTFGNSFVQILLFTLGYIDLLSLMKYNLIWTVIFITLLFIFILFFIYAVFISIYAESFRRTVIKMGYPEDQVKIKWTLKDYVNWLCSCINTHKSNKEQMG